jgi:dienelactone hydrolase
MTLNRRQCLGLAAGACLPLAWPGHAAEPLPYETLDMDWTDARRQREVPVRLYLPQGTQPLPLVVFSHGMGGTRRGYSWLGQHFARHGIASLHLQHVGSDRQLWSGNVFGLVGRLQGAAQEGEAVARVQDMRFALDTLQASALGARVDGRRIVAAGHSYGANTTLLASGARVPRPTGLVDLHDARVRAAIVISAPPFYGEDQPQRILGSVGVPSLHVTATEDVIRIPGYYSGAEDRVKVFDATGGPRKWLAVYEGGSHSMFTDRSSSGGVTLNPQVKTATQALVLAFLRNVFEGDEAELGAWPRQHAGLLARFTAAQG